MYVMEVPQDVFLGLQAPGKTQATVANSLMTAAAVDPEPISKCILAIAGSLAKIFGFGPSPWNVVDTSVIEAGQIALNQLWYLVSGEAINGVQHTTTPGQAGKEGVAIFTQSKYPNVPKGAAGDPSVDIDQAIAAADKIVADALSMVHREESRSNPFFTGGGNKIPALLRKMKTAREAAAATAAAQTSATVSSAASALPWVAAGLLAIKFFAGG